MKRLIKVLLIDDDKKIQKLIKAILKNDKFDLKIYSNANNIIKKIKMCKPDIVLLNIKLYGTSGVDAIKKIKSTEELKDIPIIAFTSYTMKGDRERFLKMGFDDYIPKPIDTRNFAQQINILLNKVE